ncbi:MAG: SCO family protein [Alteromonadaceae bacterium]|nr:SCO family protein [Alteromonadaceae bacterium]
MKAILHGNKLQGNNLQGNNLQGDKLQEKTLLRKKMLMALITVLSLISIFILVLMLLIRRDQVPLPEINGYVLNNPTSLASFNLDDHTGTPFTNKSLIGKWTVISFGYIQCPDVCPTTLMALTRVANKLKLNGQNKDVQFVFYTIDPTRDSINILANYVAYFDDEFIGLRANQNKNHLNFEQSLGIRFKIERKPPKVYQVSHGIALYVINPAAKLQAILKPVMSPFELEPFNDDHIFNDFLQIKEYFDKSIQE